MTVFDIGANIGFFSMLAASLVGQFGRVFSIEPNPDNAKMIEASRLLNGFEHVTVIQAAASEKFGMVYFQTAHSNGAVKELPSPTSQFSSMSVGTFPLDSLVQTEMVKVDFIKIDVEGYEKIALSGMMQTIVRDRPFIVTELSPGALPIASGCSSFEYLEMFASKGFLLHVLHYDGREEACSSAAQVETIFQEQYAATTDHVDILMIPS